MIGNIGSNINQFQSFGAESTIKASEEAAKKRSGEVPCETCNTRTYVDGSNDPGVSFKTPTRIAPGQAAYSVMSHEKEHYNREAAKAQKEGAEVVSNRIAIFRDTCEECGKSYVSGGETITMKRKEIESAHFNNQFFEKSIGGHFGKVIEVLQ